MREPPQPLQLEGITVRRNRRIVLEGISVAITPGEVTVVVGPLGAGKTTLLEAIIDAVPRESGDIRVGRQMVRGLSAVSRWLSYQAAKAEPPAEARVATLLDAGARLEHADPALALAVEARLGLTSTRSALAGALSPDQRQRLLLFSALISRKPFILLDEPLAAFGSEQRRELSPLLIDCALRGSGLLVTMSELEGCEALASQLVLLNRGRVLVCGSTDALRAQAGLGAAASLDQVCVALLRARAQAEQSDSQRPEERHAAP